MLLIAQSLLIIEVHFNIKRVTFTIVKWAARLVSLFFPAYEIKGFALPGDLETCFKVSDGSAVIESHEFLPFRVSQIPSALTENFTFHLENTYWKMQLPLYYIF